MEENRMEKILMIFVSLTISLLGVMDAAAIGGYTYQSTTNPIETIYVDDSNTEGPWWGTLEHPYQTIQDGALNANDHDTVYVFSGTYFSSGGSGWPIKIERSILLQGEDPATTEIVGGGSYSSKYVLVFYDTSGPAEITGFTIRKSGTDVEDAGILVNADNVSIINNIFIENQLGVYCIYGLNHRHNNCRIEQNTFTTNNIGIWGTIDNAEIAYNTIINNTFRGIYLSGNNNIIHNNLIQGHSEEGITISDSQTTKVTFNNFYDNDKDASFRNAFFTKWHGNYWGKPRILPKPIMGAWNPDFYTNFPLFRFDRRPALTPNRITPE